jgi:hypothetical protein
VAAAIAAAGFLGNWFLAEIKKARRERQSWQTAYCSLPGVLILIVLGLGLLYGLLKR